MTVIDARGSGGGLRWMKDSLTLFPPQRFYSGRHFPLSVLYYFVAGCARQTTVFFTKQTLVSNPDQDLLQQSAKEADAHHIRAQSMMRCHNLILHLKWLD